MWLGILIELDGYKDHDNFCIFSVIEAEETTQSNLQEVQRLSYLGITRVIVTNCATAMEAMLKFLPLHFMRKEENSV